ncbi:MAG: hypothetical protein M0P04_02725 [Syntrophales bacterium]|jgi:hypothetical protein|nr:hypothetical protein [Syntrophales bacterium]MDD4339468.1 hypothetical protein [Syntrophales bacterium]HOG08452.1 hypothetical protein [Syntrophales bacterium]HOS76866.1 hypothetical protein [Syntrophales bacterium]HPB70380.1 hypothetical protein [Syntrophales bacterium]
MGENDGGFPGAMADGGTPVGRRPGPGEVIYDLTERVEGRVGPAAAEIDRAGGRRIFDLTEVIEEGPVFPPEAEAFREEMIRRVETAAGAIARQILPAVAERIAREGFPEIAARIVREEIEKLKSETEDAP